MSRTVDLIFFDGCPNAETARQNVRLALREAGAQGSGVEWNSDDWNLVEWNLEDPNTPEKYKKWGSPTVLVDGEDVTGSIGLNAALACRSDGAPTVPKILAALGSGGDMV